MDIRLSTLEEKEEIMRIYEIARDAMRSSGNPTQWGNYYPPRSMILSDIQKGCSYVLEKNQELLGVFTFVVGDDPTYQKIDGAWLNDNMYGVIHRVASSGREKGVLKEILRFCEGKIANIRIDTHQDNLIMQHLLSTNGYQRCGIIWTADGSERIAYQKERND